jgi:glycerol-3-phosphate dehydrogenase
MKSSTYDLVVIGGGINGTAIALEAAGRGLKTLLCDKGDLACATSSASTKLIHGGLRYLATHQYSLVKESLQDRTNLAKFASHLVKPLRFSIPFKQKNYSYWQMKIGLWLYSHFAKLPLSKDQINLSNQKHLTFNQKFSYFLSFEDCYTDDARLVVANAKKAFELGADIQPYTELTAVLQQQDHWLLTFKNQYSSTSCTITTKAVINATGPWVETVHKQLFKCQSKFNLKLVQGSHLLVSKLYDGQEAYLLPTRDNRVIFIIPYLEEFSLIGTTDLGITHNISEQAQFKITPEEIDYLLTEVNFYLSSPITKNQIKFHWSGARALPVEINTPSKTPSKISREFKLEWIEHDVNGPYLLSVWGGKLSTHRSLAVKALNLLAKRLPAPKHSMIYAQYLNSTHNLPIDLNQILIPYSFLPKKIKNRLLFNYGADCLAFLSDCTSLADLGLHFGKGLYEAEVNYLINHEWAKTLEDILYRRTKMGFFLNQEEKNTLQTWLEKHHRMQC